MTYVFECPTFGKRFCDGPGRHPCPCGKRHVAYQAGAEPQAGIANIQNDHLTPHFDYACGSMVYSKSDRRAKYAAKGLTESSAKEHYRKWGAPKVACGRAISYAGQGDHRSSAERGVVRTKTGQRVI